MRAMKKCKCGSNEFDVELVHHACPAQVVKRKGRYILIVDDNDSEDEVVQLWCAKCGAEYYWEDMNLSIWDYGKVKRDE